MVRGDAIDSLLGDRVQTVMDAYAAQHNPTFIDIAGELEPTLGTDQQTVDSAFGGDEAKFKAINPMDIMASKKFPTCAGWFISGSEDVGFVDAQNKVCTAAKAAGMDVQQWVVPGGGHDWATSLAGMNHVIDWLGARMNLS